MSGDKQSELWRWQHARPEAEAVSLEPVGFSAIPGWDADDHCAALRCFLQSAKSAPRALPIPDSSEIEHVLHDQKKARNFFEQNFTAYRIPGEPGLLTSYFEPALTGSRERSSTFTVPVYRRPADLKPLPEGHPLLAAGLTAGREQDGLFDPYFTRGEIEAGVLTGRGLELLYVDDPIAAFIMHVQGSGTVHLEGGGAVRLSFDGKNGHSYTSISKFLIARGDLALEDAHLDGLIAWLRASPDITQALLNENKSYIFFRELEATADAPRGSMGVPLTPGRSLAADPLYHGLGLPIWVSAPDLDYEGRPFRRLLIAQDTGSAIIGPQRGDVFAGSGVAAGSVAGRIRHRSEFIVLRPDAAP